MNKQQIEETYGPCPVQVIEAFEAITKAGVDWCFDFDKPEDGGVSLAVEVLTWEENRLGKSIGYIDFHDRQALTYLFVALDYLCAVERSTAIKLIEMALTDLRTRNYNFSEHG